MFSVCLKCDHLTSAEEYLWCRVFHPFVVLWAVLFIDLRLSSGVRCWVAYSPADSNSIFINQCSYSAYRVLKGVWNFPSIACMGRSTSLFWQKPNLFWGWSILFHGRGSIFLLIYSVNIHLFCKMPFIPVFLVFKWDLCSLSVIS